MLNFRNLLKTRSYRTNEVDLTWEHAGRVVTENLFVLIFFSFIFLISYLTYFSMRGMFTVGFLTLFFGMLLWPVYKKIHLYLPGPKLLASFITILIISVVVVIPLFLLGQMLVDQLIGLLATLDINQVQQTLTVTIERFNTWVYPIPIIGPYLILDYTSATTSVISFLGTVTNSLINLVYASGQSALKFLIDLFLILALLFYALPDMDKLGQWLVKYSPFSHQTTKIYLHRSKSMLFDVLRGSFVISLVQAILSALFLVLFHIPAAGIISVLVFLFALLPVLGSGIVLIPLALFYLIVGPWTVGLAILLYQLLVVASVDNVLRPVLVSAETNIHPALMLFAVAGGIATMGIMGLLYGPLIMILFLTTIEIYQKEFKHRPK